MTPRFITDKLTSLINLPTPRLIMLELALELDQLAQKQLNDLMNHYQVKSRAEIISKAIAALKTIAHIEKTNGQLIARKGMNETHLLFR